jgi:SAM-dependent MidA family methyltransferase
MATLRSALPEPTADQRAHSDRLSSLIAAEIRSAGGWIAFDRYMQLVLYAPGLGYYTAGATKLGGAAVGGDFITAPELSPLFADALATQLGQLFKQTRACILEFGAGSGRLARDLLAALRERGTPCERYSIIEVSADLQQRQRTLLSGEPVEWLTAAPTGFNGVMLANEVLDVLPVRLFVKRGERVMERGVGLRSGRFEFMECAAAPELVTAVTGIEHEVGELPDGYASEIGFAASAWMRSAAEWLRHGALLAIDYGFPRREYYHPQRLMGTVMCHYRHHAHANPFWWPGLNDLTAHVDFTAVADAAHDSGMQVLGYTSQARFLMNCGWLDRMAGALATEQKSAAHRLVSEAEMGELFKVIAVARGITGPLIGFEHGDRTARL